MSEAIKRTRVHILEKNIHRAKPNVITKDEGTFASPHEEDELLLRSSPEVEKCSSSTKFKVLDGLFFSIQMVLNYTLILVIMKFSAWLFIAIVLGQTLENLSFFTHPLFMPIKSFLIMQTL